MNLRLARIISLILNPILLIVFVPFFILYKDTGDVFSAIQWTTYTIFFLLFMTLVILYLVRKRIFTDYDVSKREQRPLLFLLSVGMIIVYVAGLYLFHAPKLLYVIAYGVLAGICLASVINTRIKASMHVATIAAMIVAMAIVYRGFYYLLILLIPVVGYVRIKAKRHTLPETIVGGILGSLLSLIMYFIVTVFFQ